MVTITFKKGKTPTVFIHREAADRTLKLARAFHPMVMGKRVLQMPVHRVGYAIGKALEGKSFSQATRIAKRMHWPRPVKEPDPPHGFIYQADLNGDAEDKPWLTTCG